MGHGLRHGMGHGLRHGMGHGLRLGMGHGMGHDMGHGMGHGVGHAAQTPCNGTSTLSSVRMASLPHLSRLELLSLELWVADDGHTCSGQTPVTAPQLLITIHWHSGKPPLHRGTQLHSPMCVGRR